MYYFLRFKLNEIYIPITVHFVVCVGRIMSVVLAALVESSVAYKSSLQLLLLLDSGMHKRKTKLEDLLR